MPKLSEKKWAEAREWYEAEGASLGRIAQRLGVAVSTVRSHRDQDQWGPKGVKGADLSEAVAGGFAPEQTVPVEDTNEAALEIARLTAELEEERRRREAAEEAAETYNPNHELHLYSTIDEVKVFIGEERLYQIAALAANRERKRNGFNPIEYEPFDERLRGQVEESAETLLRKRTQFAGSRNLRTVKMWFNGNIIQVGVEPQLSNEAGQEGAALWKMRDKGAKLIVPYLCQTADCYREAAVGRDGKLALSGYCSENHLAGDPFVQGRRVAGVTTSSSSRGFVGIPT